MSDNKEKKIYSSKEYPDNTEPEIKDTNFKNDKKENSIRKRRVVIGAVFSVLALVGVISIVLGAVKLGSKLLDDSAEKRKYDSLLTPLVVYDPLPFESPEEADENILLASSVWATIMNEDLTQYPTDEYGTTLLPAGEVDRYYARLFGTSTKLNHRTFADSDIEFVYNEETGTYTVPPTTYPQGYTPQTVKIKKAFGSKEKIVTVGYLSFATGFNDTRDRSIVKYVDYIFTKKDGNYYLSAVRESDMKVAQSSSSSTAQ